MLPHLCFKQEQGLGLFSNRIERPNFFLAEFAESGLVLNSRASRKFTTSSVSANPEKHKFSEANSAPCSTIQVKFSRFPKIHQIKCFR
jgi:hypothetical protein